MDADKSYSSMSISQKKQRLFALLENRRSGKRTVPRKRPKVKKLDAHVYTKYYRISGLKAKVLNRVVKDRIARKSCPGSAYKKRRLYFGQDCLEDKMESGKGGLRDTQFEDATETCDRVLPYVTKLCDYRNRGQNAVIFDGKDRLLKVIFFVLSFLDNLKNPILIVAASNVLSLWKLEFLKWSKEVKVVTYKGNKGTRAAIRETEFYNEKGSIKFQVLLSSADAIVEDIKMLDHVKWELLVIDECQRPVFSQHLKKTQMLVADMKLLTVTGESVDPRQSYNNYLSLLDSEFKKMRVKMMDDIHTLKEKLSPFIAFTCKFSTPEFEEYWVPVHLSSMQVDQYCGALSSISNNSELNDVITWIQKCCDHPYLVNPDLRNFGNPLDAEINVGGKLRVLDKLLREIKKCEKRVLVLFRSSVNSEKISTGDFLDDLVHQRFGQNSYLYIPGHVLSNGASAKKRESLEKFNNVESEMFICLCDYRACHSSIRLSHLDVVILFNSDRNPLNDIKYLKKLTIDSHDERVTVFRLYSSFTVEEKALILAKEGVSADNCYSMSICQQMLAWGASYLFNKLENRTDSEPESFMDELVRELSSVLRNTGDETGPTNGTLVSNAHMQNGAYSENILLFGELDSCAKESSSWSNLVKLTQHGPKSLCPRLPRRTQKPTRNRFEVEYQDNATPSSQVHKKARRKRAGTRSPLGNHRSNENENVAEECTHPDETQRASSSLNSTPAATTTEGQQSQTDQPPQTSSSNSLAAEIERIQKECEQLTKSFQEKEAMLQSEREKEIAEVNKKYDALLLDSKTSFEREIKILQAYQKLVDANKDLAELLEQNWQEQDTPNIKMPQKETSSLNIQEILAPETSSLNIQEIPASAPETSSLNIQDIPASALRRPENRPLLTGGPSTNLPGPSSASPVFRAPAPHLRTSPSLFASSNNHNHPATSVPFHSNCPICAGSSQTARPGPSLEFDRSCVCRWKHF